MVRTPYQVALRLCRIADQRWAELDAHYIAVDLIRLPPDRFANAVLTWALDRTDPDKREEWLLELHDPLPWQDINSEAAVQAESDSFMSMMAKS